ncbi:phage tail length tape measure family protein [Sphaerochaeta sp. PS]|uniref:phage tail length tape measure family protein n=1 Tax=Sphaerochaeta sp. PS TaxID=3076336 RepID=UPI0028A39B1A|nr:phage tail length tape measure family protein [Sphaerochaeta sp. PS]MDT4761817.1 phage tail length tape measure family protein [Sphaerochaeta sp. PS]
MAKDLRIKVTSETAQAEAGLKKVGSAIDKMGTAKGSSDAALFTANLLKTGLAAAGVSVTLSKVLSTAKEAVALYAVQAKAETSLAAAIKVTGQESEFTIGQLREYASSLQAVTNYGDETILTVEQMMVQTRKIGSDIMPLATEAVLDMSTAMGTGAAENAKKLSRALADPIQGISLLKESMVILSAEQQTSIKGFVKQGDMANAQKVILEQLSATYGGLARAQGALDVSKIEQIRNTMGDIKEGLGQSIIDGISPAMTWLLEKLQDVNDKIARANREAGIVSPSSMSDKELTETWEAQKGKVEQYRRQIEQAMSIGDVSTQLIAQNLLDQLLPVFEPVIAEVNKRAREAGYASANAYGQAYAKQLAQQKIDNPQTLEDEKRSQRTLSPTSMVPSSTGIAKDAADEAKAFATAQEAAYQLVTATSGYQQILLENEIARLEALKESNLEAMQNKNLTASQVANYERLNTLLDEQLKIDYKVRDGQDGLSSFLQKNAGYAKETAEQEKTRLLALYDIASAYQRQNDLTEEQKKNIGQILNGLQIAIKAIPSETEKATNTLTTAQEAAYQLVSATSGYQQILLESEIARLEALKESNLEAMQNKNLTASQVANYERLNTLLDEQLKIDYKVRDGQDGLSSFLQKNAGYAKETAEQEKTRLLALYDIASAYRRQNGLTEEQKENIGQILNGLQIAIKAIPTEMEKATKTVREQLDESFEAQFPTTGVKKWAKDAQSAISDLTGFMQDNFGSIIDVGTSFYKTITEAQEKASKAQIAVLETQIAAEKKLYEKQTKAINSQYDARSKTLADKYAWGLMGYEEYISAQQSLDEGKTASEEAAASRYEELEKQKLAIQNSIAKTTFENTKKQSIAQSLILGAQAILQGYASLGPIGGSIAAALIAGVTAVQVATISSQQFTPSTALAEGGIVYRPTTALIGEGGEPEAVVPLSKASQFGFASGSQNSQVTNIYVTGPSYTGDQLAQSIAEGIARGQRTGRIARWGE